MTDPAEHQSQPAPRPAGGAVAAPAQDWWGEVASLLQELESAAGSHGPSLPVVDRATDNQLAQVRLGAASSLFAALQCKHAATAGHALRVALTSSAWSARLQLDERQRDVIEIAALLHDVGMIGAPDHVLMKPGALTVEEASLVHRSRRMSVEILRHSCTVPEVLEIVENVDAWYDGSRPGFALHGDEIPLGARIIAIVEAFDAMTTDHVFRPARSHERALSELFECAGSQFDPALVRSFAEFHDGDQSAIHHEVAGRWLQSLDPVLVNSYWQLNCVPSPAATPEIDSLFESKLLESMYDAVVFVDAGNRITLWNRGAERLTGIPSNGVCHRTWQPDLLQMADERGKRIPESDCPVLGALRSGVQSLRRLTICGRNNRSVAVDTHSIPVLAEDGTTLGAILLLHDATSETSLEQRCQRLYEKATRDPLTQLANRAEFDRVHEMFVAAHRQQQVPCSLIMCDLDRFKQVNDNYGHQAGDEAIKTLASVLKSSCRPGDLVARYGGEEFVVLCADCDNAVAARRAEQIRKALSQLPQQSMGGASVTASFGVTEIQPGDTPETMLRRADRALLLAKSRGRNMVVQLGSGLMPDEEDADDDSRRRRFWPLGGSGRKEVSRQTLVTPVPLRVAVEKLRGFVADHQARIALIEGNCLRLEIEERTRGALRRFTDRPVVFSLALTLEEDRADNLVRTRVHVALTPRTNRERRRDEVSRRARQVLLSLRSYLMASDDSVHESSALARARRFLAPWLENR